jgi:hypothetical protein
MSFVATSAIIAIAGTAYAAYGQQQQAKAAESTAKYNADVARDQASRENLVNAENMRRKTRDNNRLLAQVRASTAAKGLASEGTPLAVLGDAAMTLERDINDLSYEASTRYQSLAQGAKMSIWEGKQTASALKTASYGTLISGASSATTGYLQASGKI